MLATTAFKKPIVSIENRSCAIFYADTIPGDATVNGDKIFEAVDEEAYFPGKEEGWINFLVQNLNPSTPVDNGAPAGTYTVYIQFVVDLDGKLSAIKSLTKHGYGMEAEVMRILRKSPPWIPAVQAGKPVRAYRKQPVTFQVMEDKKKKRKRG
jgi:protein TonB